MNENKEFHYDEAKLNEALVLLANHGKFALCDYISALSKSFSNERCDAARYRKMRDHSGNVRWWMLSAIDLQLETMSEPAAADVDAAVDAMPEGPK